MRVCDSEWATIFRKGCQVDYVLGKFPPEEMAEMPALLKKASEAVKAFCLREQTSR